ncbi:hypothetical protein NSQ26_11955 [Bacillus sp. FSL W7-1360]
MKSSLNNYKTLYTQYVAPERAKVFILFVLLLSGIGLQLASPQVMGYYIQAPDTSVGVELLKLAAILFIVSE